MAPLRQLASGLVGLLSLLPTYSSAAPASFTSAETSLQALIGHAQNGSATDLYFHLDAPANAGWGAVAIGNDMPGSLFFVMYPNMAGNGATVSVRTATGHVMPRPIAGFEAQVSHSTMANGRMTADFVCHNCTTWPTGRLDTASSNTDWIFAVGPGMAVMSDSNAAPISKHMTSGQFTANMQGAAMPQPAAGDVSPLLSASTQGGTSMSQTNEQSQAEMKRMEMLFTAHATLLSLAFFFFMPVGVILLRLPPMMKTPAAVPLHYTSQGIAWAFSISGMGIAIYFSKRLPIPLFNEFKSYHQAIGLTATAATIFQGFLGLAHHLLFRRMGRRSPITWLHFVLGWCIIPLGMLNAPIGLTLVKDFPARNGMIAALVIILVITISVSAWGWSVMLSRSKGTASREKNLSDSETRGDSIDPVHPK